MANAASQWLNLQTDPSHCTTGNLYASPNGRYLLQQYNCQDTTWAQMLTLNQPEQAPSLLPTGYFLNWAPSGEWFLYRQTEENEILLIEAANVSHQISLNLPADAYTAIFASDGQQIIYAASAGLKLGSEMGLINLATGQYVYQHTFPEQIVIFPRLSPNGKYLAYILMPDSNIPFTSGNLWLADADGGIPDTLLTTVDAGHGFAPAWSPDSSSLVYVRRENLDNTLADQEADALHSNLYQVDITTGTTTPLTFFANSQVHAAVWSPDGQTVAFTANDAVWQLTPGQSPIQVSQDTVARHPAWLVEPTNP